MHEQIGMKRGRISSTELKILGQKNTPMIQINFAIDGFNNTVPLKLWLNDTVRTQGIYEGKTGTEVAVEILKKLGFNNPSIASLDSHTVEECFAEPNKNFEINVVYQKDKNKNVTRYLEVAFVKFGFKRLNPEEISKGFSDVDGLWRKKIGEQKQKLDYIPF